MYFLIFQPEYRLNLCLIFNDSQLINVMLIKKSADYNWTELPTHIPCLEHLKNTMVIKISVSKVQCFCLSKIRNRFPYQGDINWLFVIFEKLLLKSTLNKEIIKIVIPSIQKIIDRE